MSAEKKINVTENERAIVNFLKENGEATAAEINQALGTNIKPGSFTNAVKKGFIATADEDRVIERPAKRSVKVYALVNSDKKENAKYSETEEAILGVITDAPVTLAELSTLVDKKLVPGNVSGLIKKGNITIAGEVETEYMAPAKVRVYKLGEKPITE